MCLQVVMGDILSDLPAVSNFTFAESAKYANEAQTPLQLWLQRDPPSYQASRETRGQRADAFMREGHAAMEKKVRKGEHDVAGIEKVGFLQRWRSHHNCDWSTDGSEYVGSCCDFSMQNSYWLPCTKCYRAGSRAGLQQYACLALLCVRLHKHLCFSMDCFLYRSFVSGSAQEGGERLMQPQ